ncbi:MAG: hypothetical protein C0179_01930 [Fervidicoccus sp.]|nr:MAG: hypothetical protein C0179_01930 [Fervidicoccus sp.]
MDIVIMAGGRGERLGGLKKPFLIICGKRLIDVSIDAAEKVRGNGKVYVCMREEDLGKVEGREGVQAVECPGLGYVKDLSLILKRVTFPALILPGDMPFLSREALERFLDKALNSKADVVTLVKMRSGSAEETGISLFNREGGSWENVYFNEDRDLLDIDTPEDLKKAVELCGSTEEGEKRG